MSTAQAGTASEAPEGFDPDPGGSNSSWLGANRRSFEFPAIEVGTTPPEFRWEIENLGAGAIGPLTLTRDTSLPFVVLTTCGDGLPARGTCEVTVAFIPNMPGFFEDTLRLSDGSAQISLPITARAQYRLTIDGVSVGRIDSEEGEFSCEGESCTGLFDAGRVTVRASTDNGSNVFFAGWSSPEEDCGARQSCSFVLEQSRRVSAEFREMLNNLVFVSSQSYPANLGGVAAYDAECNRLASAAGINNASGNAFVAGLSTVGATAGERLGDARGWVRLDGRVFADTIADMFGLRVRHSLDFDETGARVDPRTLAALPVTIWTGAFVGDLVPAEGAPEGAGMCRGWSSALATEFGQIGRANGGGFFWLYRGSGPCSQIHRIACLATTRSTPATPPVVTGKRIWTSTPTYTPGPQQTPDQKCQTERPSGVDTAMAFIGYSNRTAADVLDESANYVRPDGVLVGTGAQLADMHVFAGPWVLADGTTLDLNWAVRTGGGTPRSVPTLHCNDWQSSDASLTGGIGDYATSDIRFFSVGQGLRCDSVAPILCVEP